MRLAERLAVVIRRLPLARALVPPLWRWIASLGEAGSIWLRTAGRGRLCTCCGWRGRRFLPAGHMRRPDARCPRCASLERYRLLVLYLRERTSFFEDRLTVLDVGPARSFAEACAAAPGIRYVSTDLASPLARVRADAIALPFPEACFDVIFCYHVLEYVPDDRRAMAELFRVMRPGGWGIFQVPMQRGPTEEDLHTTREERLRRFGEYGHLRLYGPDYKDRLLEAGFRVEVVRYAASLPPERIRLCAIDPGEELYVVRRPAGVRPV